jgi:phosphate transport system ATP-binding protein
METKATTPSSLSDVANSAKARKQPGSGKLGVGLEARGVHAWFGDKLVLRDVSLDFWSGTVTALIGPSGCGNQLSSAPSIVCMNLFQAPQWLVKFC